MAPKAAEGSQGCLRPQGARGANEPPGETFTT